MTTGLSALLLNLQNTIALALWQRRHKRRFLIVANRWMCEFGVRTLACHYPIRHLRDMAPEVEAAPSGRERRRMGRR